MKIDSSSLMTIASLGPTQTIAAFAVNTRLSDVPRGAVDGAKVAILDTLGVALAARQMSVGRAIVDHVQSLGGQPQARVFGSAVRTSAPLAALANGTLAHALDFDDHGHVSTYCLPASLAVGEMNRLSGAQVLEAYVVSREVSNRLVEAIEARRKDHGGPTFRGWYRVGVVGPIAAAVAAGKLLGLDAAKMANAIGIAATSSGGLRRNQGTMTKALHAGNGASQGLHAAMLALRGFTGDPEILEAPLGLFSALCLPGECDLEPILSGLGRPYELEGPPKLKPIPACTPSHMPVEAALALKRDHDFSAEDVEAIECDLHTFSLFRADPQEALAGGFCLPYMLAVVLSDGAFTVDSISESRIHDPAIRSLMARVGPHQRAMTEHEPERVTVRLRDGRTLTAEIAHAHDLTEGHQAEAKFRDCARRALPAEDVSRLEAQVGNLDQLADVNQLALAPIAV